MTMTSFESFYSLDDYRQWVQSLNSKKSQYQKKDIFTHALVLFLQSLNQEDPLLSIKDAQGHNHSFIHAWNALIQGELQLDSSDFQQIRHVRSLENVFSQLLFWIRPSSSHFTPETWTEEDLKTQYQHIVETINQGKIHRHHFSEGHECSDCGQRFRLSMDRWTPKYTVVTYASLPTPGTLLAPSQESAPRSCIPKNNRTVEVSFPSGQVLAADWIRIPELTQALKDPQPDLAERSVHTLAGRIYQVERQAALGVLSIPVGNTCPELIVNDSGTSIQVGYCEDSDAPSLRGFSAPQSICTDLWAVTMIDRQTIIDLLTPTLGESAESTLDDYIENHDVKVLHIQPGTYQVQYHPDHHQFQNHLSIDDLFKIPGALEPFFTLEIHETLNLIPKRNTPSKP